MKIQSSQSGSCSTQSWTLDSKFNQEVASIWEDHSGADTWPQSANIWSFDPSLVTVSADWVSDRLQVNETSLTNHTSDSLFRLCVRVEDTSPGSASNAAVAASSRTAGGRSESLLTSAATHFQPIRQDFYERRGSLVTDASVCGLVPCSGKCPNHMRNRTRVGESSRSRPASTSMNELSLFVGPFAESRQPLTGAEAGLPTTGSADKSTDTSDDSLPAANEVSCATPVAVDDYEAICSILNEVLSGQTAFLADEERLEEQQEKSPTNTSASSPSAKEIHVSFESFFVDPEPSGFMCSHPEQVFNADQHIDFNGHIRHSSEEKDSENRRKSFLQPPVAAPEKRSSRSPAAVRHFVIEPKIERVGDNQKPCSFFLEGNCRKSDCKFSHDLSRITCRFWSEGFCFKGDACPFRHSSGSQNGEKGALRPQEDKFAIESEADFPSLALEKQKKSYPLKAGKQKQAADKRSSPSCSARFRTQVGTTRRKKKNQKGV